VRGDTVFNGYLDDDAANAEIFRDGWYRTGDYGYIDSDGYVTLVGRLKEMINRGGEKIFPNEVEDVLNTHPQVTESVVFGIPDPWMGEIVAAVVVSSADAEERAIRNYAAKRLAYFKVRGHSPYSKWQTYTPRPI
jgi:acyl-CoA synthetase (AMP-forming)/AMP-acid ligase II